MERLQRGLKVSTTTGLGHGTLVPRWTNILVVRVWRIGIIWHGKGATSIERSGSGESWHDGVGWIPKKGHSRIGILWGSGADNICFDKPGLRFWSAVVDSGKGKEVLSTKR